MVHIYNGTLSVIRKEQNNATCSNMGATRDYHSKWSRKEKDKHHMILLTCGSWNMTQATLSIKQKQNHGHREQTGRCQSGGVGERIL